MPRRPDGEKRPNLDGVPYPPPPWRLHGRAILIPALVTTPPAPEGQRVLRTRGGRSLGGLLLADYDSRSSLVYHELLGVGGLVRNGVIPAAWITHAHVDDPASVAGGRTIWGIPKRDGDFRWIGTATEDEVTVSTAGSEVVTVRVGRRPRAARLLIAAPFAGRHGIRRAWVAGRFHGTPVSARVDVPPESWLAALSPVFARTAVVGEVALRIGPPRAGRAG